MKNIIILCFCSILCSVFAYSQKRNYLTEYDNKLFSQLIDLLGHPIPPPPTGENYDTIPSMELIDSLAKVELKIGIYPTVKTFITNSKTKQISLNCLNKYTQENSSKTYLINLEKLNSEKKHKISLIDTTISSQEQFFDHDIIVMFYKPYYNEDLSKALVKLSVSRGTLSGFLTLVCLEKNNENWKVVNSKELSAW